MAMDRTVFGIDDYREACRYLQDKYDTLGYIRKDYYDPAALANGKLVRTGKSYSDKGLQYHHIREDVVANLSKSTIALEQAPEYQAAENMCYCNLLEHLYLHILIAEQTPDRDLGIGGCAYIIQDIMAALENPNLDDRYNYGYMLTDNVDVFEALLNRFCTSALIRAKLDKTSQEVFGQAGLNRYAGLDMKKIVDTRLKAHNVVAFAQAEEYLRSSRTAILQICTCGGKTTSGLEYCRVHGLKALVLTPNDTVKGSWDGPDAKPYVGEIMNYQAFMNVYASLDYSRYGVVICDEVHHTDAPRWGEGLQYILDNTDLKVLGLTATPTALQLNGDDRYFGGRVCYGLDVAEGIRSGVFFGFDYYQSIFEIDAVKDQFYRNGEQGKLLFKQLELACNKTPISKILKDNMPAGVRKCIVFISSSKKTGQEADDEIQHNAQQAMDIIRDYDPAYVTEEYVRFISSDLNKKYNDEARAWFNRDDGHDKFLITVNMVNEGAHYDGVNTAIMLRKTNSVTLYLQQLGRVIRPTQDRNGDQAEDPNCVVFDFSNNIENLIVNKQKQVNSLCSGQKKADLDVEAMRKLGDMLDALAESQKIVKDYSEDIVAKLAALQESNDGVIAQRSLNDVAKEICELEGIDASDLLAGEWGKAKSRQKNKASKNQKGKQAELRVKQEPSSDESEVLVADSAKADTAKGIATKAEQLYLAAKVILNRCLLFGVAGAQYEAVPYVEIVDEAEFAKQATEAGVKNAEILKKILGRLPLGTLLNLTKNQFTPSV